MMNMEEKLYFKNEDGLKLCGVLTKLSKDTRKCIILCHGVTVTKDEGGLFTELAEKLSEEGYAVFRFDFRGHGESEGDSVNLTVTGEKRDLESAVKFLKDLRYEDFGAVVASFGGGAISLFVAENPDTIKALILWNSIIDYHSLLTPELPWPKKYFGEKAMKELEEQGFIKIGSNQFKIGKPLIDELKNLHPWKELQKVSIPILFIHGDKDTYVPYGDSVKYSNLFENASLVTIKGAEHGIDDNEEVKKKAFEAAIRFFLNNFKA